MKEVATNLNLKNDRTFGQLKRRNVYSRQREGTGKVIGALLSLEYWEESSQLVNLEHELSGPIRWEIKFK